MSSRDRSPPTFRSKLLNELEAAFLRRRKALSYNGELSFDCDQDESHESLEVHYHRICGAYLRFRVAASNEAVLELRSRERRQEGRLLFSATAPAVVPNAARVVEIFEEIAALSFLFSYDQQEIDPIAKIQAAWNKLALRVIRPDAAPE